MKLNWPDLELPPINLWNAPYRPITACVNKCKLDKETQCCLGCGRHIDIIVATGKAKNRTIGKRVAYENQELTEPAATLEWYRKLSLNH